MRLPPGAVHIDQPSFPLLRAHISYYSITSANGNVLGTTVVDVGLVNEPSYVGLPIKVLNGNAAGQVRAIVTQAGNTITVDNAFTDAAGAVVQIVAGTEFVILSLTGGAGGGPPPAPGISLWMFGICDPGMVASLDTVVCPNLAGTFPDDIFNNEFWMQVIHNTSVPGAAPEREIRRITDFVGATGTFTTDAFSANVEANDLVCLFHESIMGIEIIGFGTLTFDSITVPRDGGRAALYGWENNDYFKGCLLLPTEGVCRFQPRRIIGYTAANGEFVIDPNNPISQAPGLVDYVIIRDQCEFVPAIGSLNNITPSDVIGTKTDVPDYTGLTNTSSLMRYIKTLVQAGIVIFAQVNDAGAAVTDFNTTLIEATDNHYNGLLLMLLSGPNTGQSHHIDDYAGGTKNVAFRAGDQWTDVPTTGEWFVILPDSVSYLASYFASLVTSDIFHEQNDVAFNVDASNAGPVDILNYPLVANRHYIIRHLRLLCADPGQNTVTVNLWELVNDILTLVDSFVITTANFNTYYSLMDLFGLPYLSGDQLQLTVTSNAVGPYAVTGQYTRAQAG